MSRDATSDWMTKSRSVDDWLRAHPTRLVLVTTVAYATVELLIDQTAAGLGMPFALAPGLALALGVVYGSVVAVGAGFGAVLAEVVTGTFGVHSAVGYAATFLLVYVGIAFWNAFAEYRWTAFQRWPVRFVVAAVPAVVAATAVAAWGAEILDQATFPVVFTHALPERLGGTIIGGLAVLTIKRGPIFGRKGVAETDDTVTFGRPRRALAAVAVSFGWAGSALMVSLLLQPLQTQPRQAIANRFGWVVATGLGLIGPAGRQVQVLLGIVAVSILFVLLTDD